MVDEAITSDSIPDLSKCRRVPLEPGTAYRFRLTAINGCGLGDFGEVSLSCHSLEPLGPIFE